MQFLASDAGLRQINDWIAERGPLAASVTRYYVRESVLFSVWCTDRKQRTFLAVVLIGALRRLRIRLAGLKPRVTDVDIKLTRGLINNSFGGIMFGMEATMNFSNWYREISLDGTPATDPRAPGLTVLGEYAAHESGDDPTMIKCDG